MAYLNGLMGAVNPPTGVWESIISAFEGAVGNYVVAIILITLVLKVVWSAVELLTKWNQRKMSLAQAAMQPELDKVAKKYEKQPALLQQKQNEIRNRYMGKTQTGGCIIMLVIMALNIAIFFTLFAGLNNMAAYKNVASYDTTKYYYVNSLYTADSFWENGSISEEEKKEIFADYENISFAIVEGEAYVDEQSGEEVTPKYMVMSYAAGDTVTELAKIEYKTDFSGGERQKVDGEGNPVFEEDGVTPVMEKITSNENIISMLNKYFPATAEGEHDAANDVVIKTTVEGEKENILYRSQAVQFAIMDDVTKVYEEHQEGFLWIKNIWVADSSFNDSIVPYNTLAGQIGANNLEAGEDRIYNAFMGHIKLEKNGANGYFILPILCFAVAFLTTFVNELYAKKKYEKDLAAGKDAKLPQKTGKVARILMPALMAVFALFYNSVFAIYLLVGHLVSMALSVPQMMIVDKIIENSEKKKKNNNDGNGNNVVVEYSRKF